MPRAGGRRRVREPTEDRSLRRGLLPRADTRQGENTGVPLPAKGPSAPSEVFEISTFKKKKKVIHSGIKFCVWIATSGNANNGACCSVLILKENKITRLYVNHANSSWAELLNAAKKTQVASDCARGPRQGGCLHSVRPTHSCSLHAEELS